MQERCSSLNIKNILNIPVLDLTFKYLLLNLFGLGYGMVYGLGVPFIVTFQSEVLSLPLRNILGQVVVVEIKPL